MNGKKIYSKVIPKSNDWAIVQLSKNRKEFSQKIIEETLKNLNDEKERVRTLRDEIIITCNRELLRIKRNRWKIDPLDDTFFWETVKKKNRRNFFFFRGCTKKNRFRDSRKYYKTVCS